jgi:prepilin-type N-terminal cleavage/methylation domain-containing protein
MTLLSDRKGFSLIELIMVIVILGILVLGGTFGLKQVMDGYTLAQANATSTQKAQNALNRLTIELSHISYISGGSRYNISDGTANSLTYTANFSGEDEVNPTTINLSGNQVLLNNFLLTDGLVTNGLQFTYFDGNGNSVGATSTDMRLIGMALTVQVTATATRTYNARVALQQ